MRSTRGTILKIGFLRETFFYFWDGPTVILCRGALIIFIRILKYSRREKLSNPLPHFEKKLRPSFHTQAKLAPQMPHPEEAYQSKSMSLDGLG